MEAEIPCRTGKYRENLEADYALLKNSFLDQMLENRAEHQMRVLAGKF
jgi:hypothetical protein